ncbi:MAG: HlyD family type I secretion periplasmic adaptor subunit [Acetobacteraceae bacterium]|nr:HlyD family type I secretion periplasmic adaptor subunit [Acetobacteraceae bacterium]
MNAAVGSLPPPGGPSATKGGALVPAGLSVPGAYRPPQTDLAPIAASPSTRGALWFGLSAIILFLGGFAAWSWGAPLSAAAVAPGVIKVEGNRRTVQHLEGGIVREILVKEGERVEAGQVLLRMDDVAATSTAASLRDQRWQLLAQESRILAELARAPDVRFPADLVAAALTVPRATDAVAAQQTLFTSRRAANENQRQMLLSRLEQAQAQISSTEGQLRSQQRQLELAKDLVSMSQQLMARGLEPRQRMIERQRLLESVQGNIIDLEGQILRTRNQMEETTAQLRLVDDQLNNELGEQLRDVRTRLVDVEERLRPAADAALRRDVVAPVSGTVLNLRIFTAGGVVRPGDPILDIVPLEDRLVAEVQVNPNDIRSVHVGLLAEVRLPAYKARTLPYLHGHVITIASDTLVDERTRAPFYRAVIRIDEDQLRRYPDVELVPGMLVETMIVTGERSLWQYITQPLRDSFARAFREQ